MVSWALPIPRRSIEANLFIILGYARGDHLMAKTTPLLMLWMMRMGVTSEAAVLTSGDEAKGGDSAS